MELRRSRVETKLAGVVDFDEVHLGGALGLGGEVKAGGAPVGRSLERFKYRWRELRQSPSWRANWT